LVAGAGDIRGQGVRRIVMPKYEFDIKGDKDENS